MMELHWVDPPTALYVLVDPLCGEPVLGIDSSNQDLTAQREQVWERQVIPVPLARTIALPPRLHPYLLKLQGLEDPLLALTMGLAQEERLAAQLDGFDGAGGAAHAIGGWLQTGMGVNDVGEALSTMCRVNTDAPTRATYLRLADRRVLDLLCHVAGEDRVAGQFGRIQCWHYLTPMGALRSLRAPHGDGHALRLRRPEFQRVLRSEKLHRTVSTCLGAQAGLDQPVVRIDYDTVEAAVIAAELAAAKWPHRFCTGHDEITWAALSLTHRSLLQHAAVHALLADTGSQEEPPEPVRYLHGELRALAERSQAGAASVR